jgi:hypothetical protein
VWGGGGGVQNHTLQPASVTLPCSLPNKARVVACSAFEWVFIVVTHHFSMHGPCCTRNMHAFKRSCGEGPGVFSASPDDEDEVPVDAAPALRAFCRVVKDAHGDGAGFHSLDSCFTASENSRHPFGYNANARDDDADAEIPPLMELSVDPSGPTGRGASVTGVRTLTLQKGLLTMLHHLCRHSAGCRGECERVCEQVR